ncbi:polyhydroxyalkanoate synthesis repressor PhaR [Alteromonas pelagimontana]|uniref:Polyhydroxyalkanoate synthesis repressor PhaR n=1 Tax=Alteromonas pelagimontana TaxID=1858656 RepID=A0A6M4MBM6_9ALTE|nr:polyhydroxyalkanoate synthesis repressor PhaR [Alteromonas pelagimontana]QJR80602.1 polyhydroxyalkanoate synthesis repressor PhaR [Alteromonas pelagimontana]
MITIKKYPNRRLYDTSRSQYVNLDYIKTLINDRKDFQVIDSKSEEDITKSLLLQIISESESNVHQSLLTNTLLKQLIRFYDSDMEPYVREYLEQSLVNFIAQQDKMQGMMKNMVDSNPFTIFSKIVEQNMETWSPAKKSKK